MSLRKNTCRVMLLDLENVPNELARLAGEISKFHKVIACHGVAQPKLPLDVAKQLASAVNYIWRGTWIAQEARQHS